MSDPINAQVAADKQSTHSSDDEKHQQSVLPPVEGGPRLDANGEAIRTTAGVDRIEAVARAAQNTKSGKHTLYIIAFCLWLMYFVYTMQGSTTYAYSVWATSSFAAHSSGISTLSIATSIIGAVCKPFLAKMSDVFTRQYMFLVVMISYVIGFIMILKSPNLATYVVGSVFVSIGSSGLDLLTTILAADLVPLSYRGLAFGLISFPYVVTPWFTAEIVAAFDASKNWRWGYGMYAIIIPFCMTPAIAVMIYLDRRAHKLGIINAASSTEAQRQARLAAEPNGEEVGDVMLAVELPKAPLWARFKQIFFELDTPGLLLLGFGWSLLLLPFSLASGADGGYANRSLIAMFVVGALCLIFYIVYERKWAEYPTAPLRLMKNKTFITAVIIDFMYLFSGYIQSTYLSSFAYVTTSWSAQEWTYYGNALTVSLCLFGVVAGLIMKFTHRYKLMQIFGLITKLAAYALLIPTSTSHDTGRLVTSQILIGLGGGFSVVASQVSSQASVPHQDVALAISLLSLWSNIGGAIGGAIAAAIWENNMPGNLRKFIPETLANQTVVDGLYSTITNIKDNYPYESEIRQGAIKAYDTTVHPMFLAATVISIIPIVAACYQTNYYLGDTQNAYDGKNTAGEETEEGPQMFEPKSTRTLKEKIIRMWDQ